ncbi:MAG: hypothetical protein IJR11_00885 [Synergistaceae bacterium]|nr:hypothetical protein [Synergistaceae bacterium]
MEVLLEKPKLSRPRKEYPILDDLPGYEPSYIYDIYGSLTPETVEALSDDESEPITLEELKAEIDALYRTEKEI